MATAVQRSLLRHLWYLSAPLVVLALFDTNVDPVIREAMAITLHNTPRPPNFAPGKPEFPTDRMVGNASLEHFIGPQSWIIFELLGSYGAWLTLPCPQWDGNAEYDRMFSIVKHLEVVNDVAERSIKDIQDYANAAQDGAHRGWIVLVSNPHWAKIPAISKNEMEEHL